MYFDHAATSPCSSKILRKLPELAERAAYNPSSSHEMGLSTRREISRVRRLLASFLACREDEIIFTSGATEANNMVLRGLGRKRKGHIITSAVEHDSVENTLKSLEEEGIEITRLSPKLLTTEEVLNAVREDTFLVSIMAVQNEIGSIYSLEDLGPALKKKGILYHRDAVQALGKIPFSVDDVDFASFSSHKLGGLKGLGMLYLGKDVHLPPLLLGGNQEGKRRAGTENTLAILVLGEILKDFDLQERYAHVQTLNDFLRASMCELGGKILSDEDASPYLLGASFPIPAEVLLSALSLKGVYASAGSACHAGSNRLARILPYLDPQDASGFIRFSLSSETTKKQCDDLLHVLEKTINELKRYL